MVCAAHACGGLRVLSATSQRPGWPAPRRRAQSPSRFTAMSAESEGPLVVKGVLRVGGAQAVLRGGTI
eukprot:5419611-Lingulodinium_polyedra.AAC.1